MSKRVIACIIIVILIGFFLYFSPYFEREKPKIIYSGNNYWNLRNPIKIEITDNTGIKYYEIQFNNFTIQKKLSIPVKDVKIDFTLPSNYRYSKKVGELRIKAVDKSFWNFFQGNISEKVINLQIDTQRPIVEVISHSYGIGRGGAALVVYKVDEKNIDKNYIIVNKKHIFKVFPYRKNGYFISLIAWPVKENLFEASIYVRDKAGNITKRILNFYHKNYHYITSKINVSESFINGKVKEILEESGLNIPEDLVERFKLMNEILRKKNESLIESVSKNFKIIKIDNFKIYPFYPLKNAAKRAGFGDHRYYYFHGKLISESWHLGLDLASIKHAPIILSNEGIVKYTDYTGIYGNVVIIYHGLGLSSLYAHCLEFFVKPGERVKRGKIIARTDSTGAVFGDHLHFGILIQGVEVTPIEWLDPHWIRDNIYKVLKEANLELQ